MLQIQFEPTFKNYMSFQMGDEKVKIRINLNSRDESWYLDLEDSTGLLLTGAKIVSGLEFIRKYRFKNLGGYGLAVLKTTDTKKEIGRYNFGFSKDYSLFILEPNEEL